MAGEYEPNDSRKVTGQQGQGMGAPGGADQQTGGERWAGDRQQSQSQGSQGQQGGSNDHGQQQQFDSSGNDRSRWAEQVREHMEVIGADGVHVGTVDNLDGDRIKLTRADSGMGSHEGHHHYISTGLIAGIEGDKVRLSASAANAWGMEEER